MTTADQQDLDRVDLADSAVWDDGPPWELFARMQREDPVHFSPQHNRPQEGGFWDITTWEDVRAVSRDHKTFSSERRGILHWDEISDGLGLDIQRLQMISMDPPRHARLKALVIKQFTPDVIAGHTDHINQIISDVLDAVADKERFDLVADVARPIPARVIGSLLGTPPEDDATLVHWTAVFTAFEDPVIRQSWDDPMAVMAEIVEYVNNRIALARSGDASLSGKLLTAMMDAEVEGEKLNEMEIAVFFILLMLAGNDSTRATYTATMLEILRNPQLAQQLRENPELIPAAVEEGLRCYPAFAFMGRTATRDVELNGKQIKEGDRLLLWYVASNRDESVFPNPQTFDITRPNLADTHQGFGGRGRHFCLGSNLARLELKLWIQQTLERFPDLESDGDPTRVRALFLNQYNSVPVRRRTS